jgi:hypothetical protein
MIDFRLYVALAPHFMRRASSLVCRSIVGQKIFPRKLVFSIASIETKSRDSDPDDRR